MKQHDEREDISHEMAQAKAELEYDKFKSLATAAPRSVDANFEKAVKELQKLPKPRRRSVRNPERKRRGGAFRAHDFYRGIKPLLQFDAQTGLSEAAYNVGGAPSGHARPQDMKKPQIFVCGLRVIGA